MKRSVVAQQGEAKVFLIDALPKDMQTRAPEYDARGAAIISHSESGHHHVIAGAEVMERTDNVPAGMAILYAIVKNPTALRQDAVSPHGEINLDPGLYEIRVSREFDPFAEQARRVAD
jgi:hypothetical protein